MNTLELWNQYKNCGCKFIKDVNERFSIFCDIISNCPENVKIQNYLLTYYRSYKRANDINSITWATTDHKILRKLQNHDISPNPLEESKFIKDLSSFYVYNPQKLVKKPATK